MLVDKKVGLSNAVKMAVTFSKHRGIEVIVYYNKPSATYLLLTAPTIKEIMWLTEAKTTFTGRAINGVWTYG